jgi:sugar phosphate isomerase/epimerase
MAISVSLQMYTVRDEAEKDFAGTFRRVADIGYPAVELAGTGGLSGRDLRKLLDDCGLALSGAHVSLDQLETNLAASLDYQSELGNRFVICPWLPEDRRKTGDDYRKLTEPLNRAGEACRERGMQFCYHNHAFEFTKFDGQNALDILFEATDPSLVKSELDTYWVQFGGENPAAYVRKYAGRVPLLHIKDMTAGGEPTFAEIGEGILDWPAIFEASEEAGVEWYIVEQDKCARPSLESAEISLRNLQRWGIAGP